MFRESLENGGFAVASQIIGASDITRLLDGLTMVELPRSRAGVRHALQQPAVAELARDPRLLGMAREILGSAALPFRATFFDKSAASNWLVAWHQDTALPLRERREVAGWGPWSVKNGVIYAHAPASALSQVLALRLHLDDSRADNGPLRVLPGTHVLGVLSDEEMLKLSVLVMRPLLVHASSKSRSELPRRVLHIEYGAKAVLAHDLELAIT